MIIKVFLFAGAREIMGRSDLQICLDESAPVTVQRLRAALEKEYPQMKPLLDCSRIAIDQEFALPQQLISGTADVALIPPVSGG